MIRKPVALESPDTNIHIRPAVPEDLDALMGGCWIDKRRDLGRWLLARSNRNRRDGRGMSVVVVHADGNLIGYGQLTLWPRCAEISDLVVSEVHRSKGYGTAIIQYLVQHAITIGATCVEIGAAKSNPGAMSLYHRLGFEDSRTIFMNLSGNQREPVVYMELPLPGE